MDVTPRRTIAYAAGLGDTMPCYFDDAAPEGIVAHPAFCVAVEWPAAVALRAESPLGGTPQERLRAVHAGQDSFFHRPIRPGDRLRTTASVIQMRPIRPGTFLMTKFATVDATTGAPIVTSYSSTIYRDVAVEGEGGQLEEIPAIPTASDLTHPIRVEIPIAREAPHVYTECADIWNPIHTERQVALAAGLPDIILHGTATWALAASTLIQRCVGGDPTRLVRFTGRFTAMVIPGTTMTLAYEATPQIPDVVPFTVCNAAGEAAISHGRAVFAA
jgi:acyl dehydratase